MLAYNEFNSNGADRFFLNVVWASRHYISHCGSNLTNEIIVH